MSVRVAEFDPRGHAVEVASLNIVHALATASRSALEWHVFTEAFGEAAGATGARDGLHDQAVRLLRRAREPEFKSRLPAYWREHLAPGGDQLTHAEAAVAALIAALIADGCEHRAVATNVAAVLSDVLQCFQESGEAWSGTTVPGQWLSYHGMPAPPVALHGEMWSMPKQSRSGHRALRGSTYSLRHLPLACAVAALTIPECAVEAVCCWAAVCAAPARAAGAPSTQRMLHVACLALSWPAHAHEGRPPLSTPQLRVCAGLATAYDTTRARERRSYGLFGTAASPVPAQMARDNDLRAVIPAAPTEWSEHAGGEIVGALLRKAAALDDVTDANSPARCAATMDMASAMLQTCARGGVREWMSEALAWSADAPAPVQYTSAVHGALEAVAEQALVCDDARRLIGEEQDAQLRDDHTSANHSMLPPETLEERVVTALVGFCLSRAAPVTNTHIRARAVLRGVSGAAPFHALLCIGRWALAAHTRPTMWLNVCQLLASDAVAEQAAQDVADTHPVLRAARNALQLHYACVPDAARLVYEHALARVQSGHAPATTLSAIRDLLEPGLIWGTAPGAGVADDVLVGPAARAARLARDVLWAVTNGGGRAAVGALLERAGKLRADDTAVACALAVACHRPLAPDAVVSSILPGWQARVPWLAPAAAASAGAWRTAGAVLWQLLHADAAYVLHAALAAPAAPSDVDNQTLLLVMPYEGTPAAAVAAQLWAAQWPPLALRACQLSGDSAPLVSFADLLARINAASAHVFPAVDTPATALHAAAQQVVDRFTEGPLRPAAYAEFAAAILPAASVRGGRTAPQVLTLCAALCALVTNVPPQYAATMGPYAAALVPLLCELGALGVDGALERSREHPEDARAASLLAVLGARVLARRSPAQADIALPGDATAALRAVCEARHDVSLVLPPRARARMDELEHAHVPATGIAVSRAHAEHATHIVCDVCRRPAERVCMCDGGLPTHAVCTQCVTQAWRASNGGPVRCPAQHAALAWPHASFHAFDVIRQLRDVGFVAQTRADLESKKHATTELPTNVDACVAGSTLLSGLWQHVQPLCGNCEARLPHLNAAVRGFLECAKCKTRTCALCVSWCTYADHGAETRHTARCYAAATSDGDADDTESAAPDDDQLLACACGTACRRMERHVCRAWTQRFTEGHEERARWLELCEPGSGELFGLSGVRVCACGPVRTAPACGPEGPLPPRRVPASVPARAAPASASASVSVAAM